MARLFIGLRPSPLFRDALSVLQENLCAAGAAGRWLAPESLHLTLAFIGERPDPEAVLSILPPVENAFSIALSHPGFFPKADVLWAGTVPCPELDGLAARVRDRLTEGGVSFDRRPFVPHITLARKPKLPEGMDLSLFPVPTAEMTVRELCLYKSELGESGMMYTVIGSTRKDEEGVP